MVIHVRRIYCDMDQVLVNFLGGARRAFGKEFNDPSLGKDDAKWVTLATMPGFWLNLEWMPDAQKIWERIKDKDTYILSACPSPDLNPLCAPEKKQWCVRELGIAPERIITVFKRTDKYSYARKGHPTLLIDDHYENCMNWTLRDGMCIWHHTVPETLLELRRVGL